MSSRGCRRRYRRRIAGNLPDGMLISPNHLQEQVLHNRIRVGTRLTREHARLRGGSDASRARVKQVGRGGKKPECAWARCCVVLTPSRSSACCGCASHLRFHSHDGLVLEHFICHAAIAQLLLQLRLCERHDCYGHDAPAAARVCCIHCGLAETGSPETALDPLYPFYHPVEFCSSPVSVNFASHKRL